MCDCIGQISGELQKANTRLVVPIILYLNTNKTRADRVSIETIKINSKIRKRKMTVLASYCPFCGEKYE